MFIDRVRIEGEVGGYLAVLPVVRALISSPLRLTRGVTIFTGENGSGKSTLVEALAAATGANPEGGSRNADFTTTSESVSDLWRHLVVTRSENARDVFFVRGESFFNLSQYYEQLAEEPLAGLTRLSHGQSLLRVIRERLGERSLILLDEPEDGLSVFAQLELLGTLSHLACGGAQVIITTHSPILLAIPGAQLLHISDPEASDCKISPVAFDDCEAVRAWQEFVNDPRGTAGFLVKP